LTLRDNKSRKSQVVSEQVKVRAQDRVRIVKMDSSKPMSDQESDS
jgi:NADH-quinone oxidoreductase subunit J